MSFFLALLLSAHATAATESMSLRSQAESEISQPSAKDSKKRAPSDSEVGSGVLRLKDPGLNNSPRAWNFTTELKGQTIGVNKSTLTLPTVALGFLSNISDSLYFWGSDLSAGYVNKSTPYQFSTGYVVEDAHTITSLYAAQIFSGINWRSWIARLSFGMGSVTQNQTSAYDSARASRSSQITQTGIGFYRRLGAFELGGEYKMISAKSSQDLQIAQNLTSVGVRYLW